MGKKNHNNSRRKKKKKTHQLVCIVLELWPICTTVSVHGNHPL